LQVTCKDWKQTFCCLLPRQVDNCSLDVVYLHCQQLSTNKKSLTVVVVSIINIINSVIE